MIELFYGLCVAEKYMKGYNNEYYCKGKSV